MLTVAGLTGTITDVNVTLTGLTHPFSHDVDVLLDRFLDRTARRGVAYRYRIKAVNRDDTTSWFGPVRVT